MKQWEIASYLSFLKVIFLTPTDANHRTPTSHWRLIFFGTVFLLGPILLLHIVQSWERITVLKSSKFFLLLTSTFTGLLLNSLVSM